MRIYLGIAALSLFYVISANALTTADTKGCRIRITGMPADIVPDFIGHPEVKKGILISKDVSKLLSLDSNLLETTGSAGFVTTCSCVTKGSSPVKIVAAIEYSGGEENYKPSFSFVRIETLADLTRLKTVSIYSFQPNTKYSADFASISSIKKLEKAFVKGSARKSYMQWTEGAKPQASKESDDSTFYALTWSNIGRSPTNSELTNLLGMPCL